MLYQNIRFSASKFLTRPRFYYPFYQHSEDNLQYKHFFNQNIIFASQGFLIRNGLRSGADQKPLASEDVKTWVTHSYSNSKHIRLCMFEAYACDTLIWYSSDSYRRFYDLMLLPPPTSYHISEGTESQRSLGLVIHFKIGHSIQ